MKIKKVNEMSNYSSDFIDWLNNRTDKDEVLDILQLEGDEIEPNVYDFYGDKVSGVKIDVNDLLGYSTQCGIPGNSCFDLHVVNYLKNCGVNHIISAIFLNEPNALGHCLIPFENEKEGKKFSKMIEKNNGSLNPDGSFDDEYMYFETE